MATIYECGFNDYKKAIEYIKTIKDYRVPLEKLTVLAFASILITNSIDEYWEKEKDNLPKKFSYLEKNEFYTLQTATI